MTSAEFEFKLCQHFNKYGYWALNIPRNKFSAQPFDVLAIRGSQILAIDCKLCSTPRFPFTRIEDNQWSAFEMLKGRTNAWCGFACYYNGDVYYIPIEVVEKAMCNGDRSVKLDASCDFKNHFA